MCRRSTGFCGGKRRIFLKAPSGVARTACARGVDAGVNLRRDKIVLLSLLKNKQLRPLRTHGDILRLFMTSIYKADNLNRVAPASTTGRGITYDLGRSIFARNAAIRAPPPVGGA
jgi:hypothetical protein